MFGFDQDEPSVFEETARFVVDADYDVCGFSIMTPYPGTLNWFEMLQNGRIVSCDWNAYDQHHVVYKPVGLTAEQLRDGQWLAYDRLYAPRSLLQRFPLKGGRSRALWSIYNLFYRRMEISERDQQQRHREARSGAGARRLSATDAAAGRLAGADPGRRGGRGG